MKKVFLRMWQNILGFINFMRGKPYCFTCSRGIKTWHLNGKYHRADGPAVIYPDSAQQWFLNGKRHREDGPAYIHPSGHQEWYLNGLLHNEDGPAIICSDGRKEWWIKSKRHREDGPALIRPDGTRAWYLNGKWATPEEVFSQLSKEKQKEIIFNSLDEWK